MVTDPPYGVNYDPEWRNKRGLSSSSRTGKVHNDERADWSEAWALFPGTIAYVWHGALRSIPVAESLVKEGFAIRAQIVWAKERLVIGRGDYHWQHEPCWYAVRTKGHWVGDRKQTTLWTIPSGGQDAETQHGTQKPVECMRRPMLNHTRAGEAIYEPFLGSGTTLIAAETTGRACLAVELDPHYVDVAVRRWQAFTGAKAILLADDRSFDDVAHVRLTGVTQAKPSGEAGHRGTGAGAPGTEPQFPNTGPSKDRGATSRTADSTARKRQRGGSRNKAEAESSAADVSTPQQHGTSGDP
jgi:hypothetical protein